jgi:hypothetical protein
MTKKTKIILMVCGIVTLVAILTLALTTKKGVQKTMNLPTPTKVVVPTRTVQKYFSDTGAQYISPADQEYTEIQLIKILRSKVPITNDYFSIAFDYQINKFVVKIVNSSAVNRAVWKQWQMESGYNQISDQYWQIE